MVTVYDGISLQSADGYWGVAKLVRHLTLDQVIVGSSPASPAIYRLHRSLLQN